MNSGPKPVAELHQWLKLNLQRDTFQGYIQNDITHMYKDGHFLTIEADDVKWNDDGCLVYDGPRIYILWFAHQKVPKKDLFDEN